MKNKPESDSPATVQRFDPRQVADFSFADGAEIRSVKLQKPKRPRIKQVIENTKPEL